MRRHAAAKSRLGVFDDPVRRCLLDLFQPPTPDGVDFRMD
jgi:hypothetical protein